MDKKKILSRETFTPKIKGFPCIKKVDSSYFPYSCDDCNKIFTNMASYFAHRSEHLKVLLSKTSKTKHPDGYARTRNKLLQGKFYDNDQTALIRTEIFDQGIDMFGIHIFLNNSKRYDCKLCGAVFKKRSSLDFHLCMHKRKKPYVCIFCETRFKRIKSLYDHLPLHFRKLKAFRCKLCPRSFRTKFALDHHTGYHNKEKPHKCEICSKSFSEIYYLEHHRKRHEELKPYICNVCSKAFNSKYTLQKHIREHRQDPLICKHCNKKFFNRYYYNKHERNHTEKQTYPCDLCGKIYGSVASLNVHKKSHASEKVIHFCTLCPAKFMDKYGLRYHMEGHENKGKYQCKTCQQKFVRPFQLNRHLKNNIICRKAYVVDD